MANIKLGKEESEIRKMKIVAIKDYCVEISKTYNKIVNGDYIRCCKCGDFKKSDTAFYMDKRYFNDRYPICKECILAMVEQREKKNDEPNETKESVQKVLQMMDKVYDDKFYEDCIKGARDGAKERNRNSPFSTYITAISSLPNWKGMTWKDSDFGSAAMSADENETRIIKKTVKDGRKRFGNNYTDEELQFMENEYQDWISRYECSTKAQEEIFENLSLLKLIKRKLIEKNKPTKDVDKQMQDWLDAGKLKPKQDSSDGSNDSKAFGVMLQHYEYDRPLPEIDPELKDVDKIGLYIDVFFRGHTAKMLDLMNTFANIYEKFMSKFTVKPPQYDEDEDSEVIFEKVFGSSMEE